MPFPKDHKYTAEEFFSLIPENDSQQYELIDGEVVALSAPSEVHQNIALGIYTEARMFIRNNHGACRPMAAPFDVVLNDNNVVQPDCFIVCDTNKMDGRRCNGAPDFIVEVTSSNYVRDYQDKLKLYCEAGVREYWIVDALYEKVVVYIFGAGSSINIYTFDNQIPVGIYGGELSICIKDLLKGE